MKILMILTSHDQLGNTGNKTGFWLEEFAAPYYTFKDAGVDVTLVSPAGGQPPLDPKSDEPDAQTADTERFRNDAETQQALANTGRLADVTAEAFDAVFYPGGHGPLWDLTEDKHSIALVEAFARGNKPHGFVCHGPGALLHAKGADGKPLIQGREVTGFTNGEEAAVGLTDVVPFLIEDEFQRLGARYSKAGDWQVHVMADGQLVTGQNPASSAAVAEKLLKLLG
ncbi:type 1 glutamine amidotransferase domain-containing protein [Pseudomonas sp. OIL-1]|uniref:type 1 glutamine amidotransferase domain-containing protein n=1 Tax=Pseudomonas sp. OIL-1 TaxID=2706126 RepID=UPI0013A77895|nr:type 1 glutamine amidotransferase domain-containing protein [Pseudomonas sp. OIL-1]QIB51850.1 type 1 glutamine amidotransferase domain-containing protein [Pseudomonas sp. OIL-1]